MANEILAQRKLEFHVKYCQQCSEALGLDECCQIGQVLAALVATMAKKRTI